MEFVESSNLKQLFARQDPVLQEYLCNILIDMAVALEHVHDSGFMHLDFKPENVLVTRNANVRLVDFDLAQPLDRQAAKDEPQSPAPRLIWRPNNCCASRWTTGRIFSPSGFRPMSCSPGKSPLLEIIPKKSWKKSWIVPTILFSRTS